MIEENPEVIAKRIAEMQAMASPDWQEVAKGLGTSDKERLAIWMIEHGFATGHGDNMDDLLKELTWQINELRQQRLPL